MFVILTTHSFYFLFVRNLISLESNLFQGFDLNFILPAEKKFLAWNRVITWRSITCSECLLNPIHSNYECTCVDANPPFGFLCVVIHFMTGNPEVNWLACAYTRSAYDVISISIGLDCWWGGCQWWCVVVFAVSGLCQCFIPSNDGKDR